MTPKARQDHLLVHEVDNEAVIYDQRRKQAHRLNETAATVWSRLDGETTAGKIAADLGVDEHVVELAIDDLANARLLETGEPLPVSRRAALSRVAGAAAIGFLLPVVTSMTAPFAAQAQSAGTPLCGDPGVPCK